MSNKLGFISANLHRSFDKTRVANYAQWERKEDVEAMFKVLDSKEYTNKYFKCLAKIGVLIRLFTFQLILKICGLYYTIT
jgi:hypothetical protein